MRWQLLGIACVFFALALLIFFLNQRRLNFTTWALALPLAFFALLCCLLALPLTQSQPITPLLSTLAVVFIPIFLLGLPYFAIRDWRAPLQFWDSTLTAQGWHKVARARYRYPLEPAPLVMSIALDRVYARHRVLIEVDNLAAADFYVGRPNALPVPTRATTQAMPTPKVLQPFILQAAQPAQFQHFSDDAAVQELLKSLLTNHASTFSEVYLSRGTLHWLGRGFFMDEANFRQLREEVETFLALYTR